MMGDVRDIGSRRELFVDDWLIEQMQGLSLRLHHPIPREVALAFDRAWEGPISYDQVVMKEGERYRLWYRAGGDNDQRTAYAESRDGIHWERPALGIFEHNGSNDNNIVLESATAKAVCVFRDDNPATADGERYKAIGIGEPAGGRQTLRGMASFDGIHWHRLQSDPLVVAPDDERPWFDTHNVAFWDALQKQYVIYARGWLPSGERSIRRTTSPDFRTWSEFEWIDMGDAPAEHLYKNACSQYFRAPHIYLMFPKRFVPERRFDPDWPHSGLSDTVFMSSRDGLHWDRRFMEAFLRPGPDPKNWNERNLYAGVGIVPTGPAEISLYYLEHFRHPSARLRRATLRTDGFVSINAPYAGGEVTTRPLTFAGDELAINYATSAAGSVRVEIQDEEGRPIEGYELASGVELYGDEIERKVTWAGHRDVRQLAGRPIRLRFAMQDADLYSIHFRPAGRPFV
jgi:hypothetical protein